MAESFLFNIVEKVLEKIGSVTRLEIGLARDVKHKLRKLEDTLSTIKAVLLDAEEQQAKSCQLSIWLGRLKDFCYDVEDVLDEVQYKALQQQVVTRGSFKKVCNFFSCSNVGLDFKVGHKIKKIRERLDDIAVDKANFHLTVRVEDGRAMHMGRESHSFMHAPDVIGRDEDKERIVQLLMHTCDHENISVIPIVGLGGLGKTTLAKLVCNDERVVRHFLKRIWVCVSEYFDVKTLAKEIINNATGMRCGDLTMELIQTHLRDTLSDKIFLLVLDDIWNENHEKWIELKSLLMVSANGSKIIVTTRSQSIALFMGTVPMYKLKGLPHEDCMSLFVKRAFKKGEEKQYPNLLKIGEEIVKKCVGVPLTVTTLGSLLYMKTNLHDWLYVKDNEIWKLEQEDNRILLALRLSYNKMSSQLKRCFAFCSIFSKDFVFYEVDLIQMWIAQGLLQSSNESHDLEDIGEQYVRELRLRCFFEDVKRFGPLLKLKMHDLVHDLALLVAQTECCTINSYTQNISMRDNIPKRFRHVSFSGKDLSLKEVPRFLLDLKNVRTIFFPVQGVEPTSKSFAETCISKFKYLRFLDLRPSRLEVLPNTIGNLKHLRYLDLSWNNSIKKLPNSICKLHNLQALGLSGCSELEELPRDVGNLVSLRFLLLTTNQIILPKKGIGRLMSLRFLLIERCPNLKSLGEGIQCLKALRTLAIWQCGSLKSLPRNMKYLTALETLVIWDCEKINLMDSEDDDIQGHTLSIRCFWINGLPELVALPQWLQAARNTLQLLHIERCRNLVALSEQLQSLTSLQKLEIVGCPKLSALPEGMDRLTALRELTIQQCSSELRRRCKQETGEDWPKISHVPEITLDEEETIQ